MAGLLEELKRRNVFKVGAAYVVMAWLLAQGVDVFLEGFGAPEWVTKTILLLLIIGFPIAVFFAWAFELTPEGIKKEKDVDRSQSITHQTGRKLDYMIIGVLLLALGWFAWDKFVAPSSPVIPADTSSRTPIRGGSVKGSEPFSSETAQESDSAEDNKRALTPFKSIAVLPFVNMSEDASNEYFSDGISEEILNALAKVQELQVAGRTSSFSFKGENQDLRRIGEALGVAHILEGSVRKAGNKVRITAQLIRVDNGFHLWSESYDRELNDVFAIQDEIANAILEQLKTHLGAGETVPVMAATRTDSRAYDLYLLAKQRIYERMQMPLEAAAELLDQAMAIDPGYAPAYAQRGITTHLLSETQYGDIPQAQAMSQSKLFIDQALRLDPDLAEGWAALGLWHQDRPGETGKSIEALEKALAINPGLIDAANWLNNAYIASNRPAEALAVLEDIMRRDPLYRPGLGNLTFLYVLTGQREKARDLIEKVRPFISQDANMLWLDGFMFASAGELAKSLPLAEAAVKQQPQDRVYRIGMSLGLLETHQYERVAEEGYWWVKARALKQLGRIEEATLLAQKWADQGDIGEYFALLNATGQSDLLLRYLEERWPDLEDFEAAFPSSGYHGYRIMNQVALAYQRAGNQPKFDNAMYRVRSAHDSLASQGIQHLEFFANEASYYALSGERDQALEFLAKTIDGGRIFALRISDDLPFFRGFEGDPQFEAIQARMIEHLNRERAELGLKPVEA